MSSPPPATGRHHHRTGRAAKAPVALTITLLAGLLADLGTACTFDPPPEVELELSGAGIYPVGTPLQLHFSEPIRRDSLYIRIWDATDRNIEGEFSRRVRPRLGRCGLANSPCGTTVLSLEPNARSATVELDPHDLGQPDVPLVLEILAGVTDADGHATGSSVWFDFQFQPERDPDGGSGDPVEFDEGVYILVSTVDDPLPTVITLIMDLQAAEDGHFAMAGAEGDEIGDAPRNTMNPEELEVDTSPEGFAVHALGRIDVVEGERFMTSEPFDISLAIGPVHVRLEGIVLNAIVETSEHSGHDGIEGTLSYTRVALDTGTGEFEYPAGTATFAANYVPPELIPEGTPRVCSDLCGAVTTECNPPPSFPPDGICD